MPIRSPATGDAKQAKKTSSWSGEGPYGWYGEKKKAAVLALTPGVRYKKHQRGKKKGKSWVRGKRAKGKSKKKPNTQSLESERVQKRQGGWGGHQNRIFAQSANFPIGHVRRRVSRRKTKKKKCRGKPVRLLHGTGPRGK